MKELSSDINRKILSLWATWYKMPEVQVVINY